MKRALRAAAWLTAEYNNLNAPGSFYTTGAFTQNTATASKTAGFFMQP